MFYGLIKKIKTTFAVRFYDSKKRPFAQQCHIVTIFVESYSWELI